MSNEQTIKTAINYLKEHPFSVIQLSDKEKFHTGMLCFTLNKYPSLFKTIFELEGKGYTASVEENSVDLVVKQGKVIILIVESKFKTGLHKSKTPEPHKEKKGKFINQLEKIRLKHPKLDEKKGYYLLSLLPVIEKDRFEFKGIQFTVIILKKLQELKIGKEVIYEEDSLILLWIKYLKNLKVIVDYFIENEMNCINLKKSENINYSSLSGLLKRIKLNGVFESYRYGLVQQKVEDKLSDIIKKLLRESSMSRNGIEQIGELFNSHGNAGLNYAFAIDDQKYFGIQWQGVLKIFIVTREPSSKDGVSEICKYLRILSSTKNNGEFKNPSKGLFSSVTIKDNWDIYGNINEMPNEIVDYLNKLNHKEIEAIVENEK